MRIVPGIKNPEIASLAPGDLVRFYEGNVSVDVRIERVTELNITEIKATAHLLIREQMTPEHDYLALHIEGLSQKSETRA